MCLTQGRGIIFVIIVIDLLLLLQCRNITDSALLSFQAFVISRTEFFVIRQQFE